MDADTSIQDDIHYLVLDFLAHQATETILLGLKSPNEPKPKRSAESSAEQHLELFDSYFTFCAPRFKSASKSPAPLSTVLRVQLLQFVVSYDSYCQPSRASSRFSASSLARLRGENQKRAALWSEQRDEADPDWMAEEVNLGEDILESMRAKEVAQPSPSMSQPEVAQQKHESEPTLGDLIPAFMKLTSTRMELMARSESSSAGGGDTLSVRSQWLYLAAEMMLQASIDDLSGALAYSGSLQGKVHNIFSWGFLQTNFSGSAAYDDAMDIDDKDSVPATQSKRGDKQPQNKDQSEDEESSKFQTDLQQLDMLNRLFRQSDPNPSHEPDEHGSQETQSWESIRRNYMMLIPDVLLARRQRAHAEPLTVEMARLEEEHSRQVFHQSLVGFLNSLMTSIAPPLLLQLESPGEGTDDDIWIEEMDITSDESARLRAIAKSFR